MGNGYNADLMKYRASLIHSPRPTKHPGSKKGRIPEDWHPGKGSAFKAVSRPVRRRPGWKKKMLRAIMEAKRQQAEAERLARLRAQRAQLDREVQEGK